MANSGEVFGIESFMRFSISRMRCSMAFEVVPESEFGDSQPTAQRLSASATATSEGIRRVMS